MKWYVWYDMSTNAISLKRPWSKQNIIMFVNNQFDQEFHLKHRPSLVIISMALTFITNPLLINSKTIYWKTLPEVFI